MSEQERNLAKIHKVLIRKMKRIGNLKDIILSEENCKNAIIFASKYKRNRKDVKRILEDIDNKTKELQNILLNYVPSEYKEIIREEGLKKKTRHILVPKFWPDQCVQHAVIDPIRDYLLKRFYYWSCSNLPGRGNKHAKRGIERATLKDSNIKYYLQMDIKHCYQSISNELMSKTLRKFVKDTFALEVLDKIISSSKDGLPIGNYSSPWLCNMYLDALDQKITQEIKPFYYVRYADDIILIEKDKKKLQQAKLIIEDFIKEELKLELHSNNQIKIIRTSNQKYKNDNCPINFIGYRFCVGYTLLRKLNALTIMRQCKKINKFLVKNKRITYKEASGFISRIAQTFECKSCGLYNKYISYIPINLLKEVIRRESKRKCSPRIILYGSKTSSALG